MVFGVDCGACSRPFADRQPLAVFGGGEFTLYLFPSTTLLRTFFSINLRPYCAGAYSRRLNIERDHCWRGLRPRLLHCPSPDP